MNLPNRLTLLRIVLAPVFLLLLLWEFPFHNLIAGLVFGAASVTDLLDGRIARKHGMITNLGKFLDPLADKMLTTAAFLGFMVVAPLSAYSTWVTWAVMIVLTREFLVTSVRLLAAKGGKVVAASLWGKAKTVAQMVAIIYMLAALEFCSWQGGILPNGVLPEWAYTALLVFGVVCIWVSTVLTVISGIEYFWQNREFFLSDEK